VFAVAAPLAAASIFTGSIAFAASQSGSDGSATTGGTTLLEAPSRTPATPADGTTPPSGTTPNGTTPGKTHDPANCPNMGGSSDRSGSDSSSNSSFQTSAHARGRGGPSFQ
jgi:hypothetical protein